MIESVASVENVMAKAAKPRPPVHPGTILQLDLLEPLGMSSNQLAKELRVPANRLSQIVRGRRGIAADTSLRLARYFGFSPEYWLNMQAHYDLEVIRRQSIGKIEREVKPLGRRSRPSGTGVAYLTG
jgi:addiction module HigA family antidote